MPRELVLVGGGHSHVEVLRRFALQPAPDVRLTLISRDTHTPYSGMLPGYVAGHYRHDEVHIDLRRLTEFAGARFICDEAVGIEREARQVLVRSQPAIPFDLLSINIGSSPRMNQIEGANKHAVPVKPIHCFNDRWMALLKRVRHHSGTLRIAVVGGGAAGVELLLAMQHRLRREFEAMKRNPDALHFTLFSRGNELLPTHNARVRRYLMRILARRGVELHTGTEIESVEAGVLMGNTGTATKRFEADEIIWVTQASGAPWLADTGLALDEHGFIHVDDTLQSLTDPRIFAAGDIATQITHPREKAGVIAVRQGRPLADNLRACLSGQSLKPYVPQRHWLSLIGTGDRHAVASRGRLSAHGAWVWHWKEWIDRRFMARYDVSPSHR